MDTLEFVEKVDDISCNSSHESAFSSSEDNDDHHKCN